MNLQSLTRTAAGHQGGGEPSSGFINKAPPTLHMYTSWYFKDIIVMCILFFHFGFELSIFTSLCCLCDQVHRCGSRIWSRGGPQFLRSTVADVVKRSRVSEVSILWPGSRARLRALEAFGFLMLKYAFSHILDTLFLLFLTSILTPKVDKNRALDFTSINLRHSDMLHLFFNLHGKVML